MTKKLPVQADAPTGQPVVGAINQMFAEFELVYHNQYNKAFNTKEKEDWAKKLWYSNLKDYSAAQILDAAHKAIKESDFLPTVHGVIKFIEKPQPLFTSLPELSDKMKKEDKLAALAKLRKDTGL